MKTNHKDIDPVLRRRRLTVLVVACALFLGALALIASQSKSNLTQSRNGEQIEQIDPQQHDEPSGPTDQNSETSPSSMDINKLAGIYDEYSGNPAAFNSRYGNTRFKGELTFNFLTGPDENGLYMVAFQEYDLPFFFGRSQYPKLEGLRTGDRVTVSGIPRIMGPGVGMFIYSRIE